MQLHNVAAHSERGIDLPQVVKKSTRLAVGTSLGYTTHELSKNDDRGNEISLWPNHSRKPGLQSNLPQSFDRRTVSFGQATVKTLKDTFLNVIVIEKNCSTSVMKSPGLWGLPWGQNQRSNPATVQQTRGCYTML